MANYNESIAYDLSRYDSPAVRSLPEKKSRPKMTLHRTRKSAEELRAEARQSTLATIKFFVIAAILFSFVGVNIYSRAEINSLNKEIVSLNKQLSEKQSEHTRLTMALNSKVSLEKVEDYAVNVLGMVKRDRYQVTYFDLSEENMIISSQNQ